MLVLVKKADNYDFEKKKLIILMSNNMPKTITRQQRYPEEIREISGVPISKPLGGSKVNSAFHLSEVSKLNKESLQKINQD